MGVLEWLVPPNYVKIFFNYVMYNNFECLRYNYLLCFNMYVTIFFSFATFFDLEYSR